MAVVPMQPDELTPATLVEVTGLAEQVPAEELFEAKDLPRELQGARLSPNGWQGQVISSSNSRCLVETFQGLRISVALVNLKLFEPLSPEQGGFHIAWPPEGAVDALADFSARSAAVLARDGYCVVQLSVSQEVTSGAVEEALYGRQKWKRMRQELEAAYLGRHVQSKTAWLQEMVEEKEELETPVDTLDLYLARFTQIMLPVAPFALDFMPHSRTSGMLRVPLSEDVPAEKLSEEDIFRGLVDDHVDFLKRRRLCMLLTVDGSGAELTLIPKDSAHGIVFTLSSGKLVIFRHDRISYTYRPQSEQDLVLQSWVLTPPVELAFAKVEGDRKAEDELFGLLSGPNTPDGRRSCCYGIGLNLPGYSQDNHGHYWAMIACGTDAYIKCPSERFDIDAYTRTDDEWQLGFTYTVHGGFCQDILSFDPDFFEVPMEEAKILAPACRNLLERGYEAFYKSGYTKKTLKNRHIGVYVGHSGDDWSFDCARWVGEDDCFKYGFQARKWSAIAGRLCFALGLKGPQLLTDTACSSALVAYAVGHTALRQSMHGQSSAGASSSITEALMAGANMIPGPGNYINLCGPHMLSIAGRCFTFDKSADGFERGEGASAFYVRSEDPVPKEAFATIIGACTNQDGRSASMTAPNGPSQQECIRGSMREAGLNASQITCSELHGTGTALGDPIEVGALRGVMQDRKNIPIMQTSAKSHMGHLEANAGSAGIIKCMLMCNACAGTPNCHLVSLNPHLDVNGYPTIFNTELTEYGNQSGYSGVSSFGFGGANARADVFAIASKGARKTGQLNLEKVDFMQVSCPYDEGPMHYIDGREVPFAASSRQRGRYRVNAIRDEFDTYDYNSGLFEGKYQLSPPEEEVEDPPSDPVCIVGSWDSFKEAKEMLPSAEPGSWSCLVQLGETRCERFQLRINGDAQQAIYPAARNGSQRTRVMGPHQGKGLYWLIDGRDGEVPEGSLYLVTFCWGLRHSLRWELVNDSLSSEPVMASKRHKYCVLGSWTSWNCLDMTDVSDPESKNAWETTFRIGMSRSESFRIMRDRDPEQVIYPARSVQDEDCATVPVRGPDEYSGGKSWQISGKYGEQIRIRLQVLDGLVSVSTQSMARFTAWSAQSLPGPARRSFWISGSFNSWTPEQMLPGHRLGVFLWKGRVGPSRQERFTICLDEDPGLQLYPESPGSTPPGLVIVKGPGPVDDGRDFVLVSLKADAEFEIIVDLNAADKRKVVDVRWLSDRIDVESMKESFLRFFSGAIQK